MADQGCLSGDEIEVLRRAMPGQAPLEIAQHLAGCAACQERALAEFAARPARKAVQPPSLQRSFVLVAVVLVALLMFFYSVLKLAGLA